MSEREGESDIFTTHPALALPREGVTSHKYLVDPDTGAIVTLADVSTGPVYYAPPTSLPELIYDDDFTEVRRMHDDGVESHTLRRMLWFWFVVLLVSLVGALVVTTIAVLEGSWGGAVGFGILSILLSTGLALVVVEYDDEMVKVHVERESKRARHRAE